jgi:site-specific recombinase XerD
LTYLAVRRKVSASSQNQAFNALLFFYRHVLKKEFGEIKDIPRAKRKPYIPTVLSREDVDAIITRLSALIRKSDDVFFYIVSPPASL